MADDLIPLNQLTDAEVEFMIQQKAEDEAWTLYPLDPIYRENDIKKRRERIKADLAAVVEEIKRGKRDMPGIHPSNCGRDPNVELRPHQFYKYYDMIKSAGPVSRGDERRNYTYAQIQRLGFLTDKDVKLFSLHLDSSKIIDPFHLRIWFIVSNHADAIRPVLRLASRLFMSPPSIRFLHALMFNNRSPDHTARRIWNRELTEMRYNEEQNNTTAELTIPVMKVLTELSKDLSWRSFDKSDPKYQSTKVQPWSTYDGFTIHRKATKGSDIFIDCTFLDYLEKFMLQSNRSPQTICIAVRLRFYLAIVLCHELCHALNKWVHVSQGWNPEPFFMDYNLTECGFSCKSFALTHIYDLANRLAGEQEVFGGKISYAWIEHDGPKAMLEAPLRIEKWPSTYDYGDYIISEDLHRLSSMYLRRYPKASSTSYFIWTRWIESLFLDENWDKVMAEDKLDCLRLGKSFGYRVWGYPNFVDPDWRRSQSSEALEEDWKGRVLYKPWLKSQLTPTPPSSASFGGDTPTDPNHLLMNLPPTWDRDAAILRGYSPADPGTWTSEILFGPNSPPNLLTGFYSMSNQNAPLYSSTDPNTFPPVPETSAPSQPQVSSIGPNTGTWNQGSYTPVPPQAPPPIHPDYVAWAAELFPSAPPSPNRRQLRRKKGT